MSFVLISLVIVSLASTGPKHSKVHATKPAEGPSVRKQLTANYAAVTRALARHDIAGVSELLAYDYRAIGPNGDSVDRQHVLSDFSRQMNAMNHITWPRTIKSLSVKGPSALAVVDGHLSAITVSKPPHRLELIATTQDSWVRSSAGWRLKSSRLVRSKMLLDGKPRS